MSEIVLRMNSLADAESQRAQYERQIVVVVGMHRSGTSLCSNVLGLLGVDMADEAGPNRGNETGHFERWDIVALQDEILALFDRAYYSPTHDFPLPPAWWADFRVRPIRERLKALVENLLVRGGPIGFKDPRTTKLMPVWNQIFAELRLRPRFVVCLRNPAHVAISLQTRDGADLDTAEFRALDYIVDALRHTRGRDRCFIHYDEWFGDPFLNARKLLEFVNPEIHIEPRELEIAIEAIVRPEANRSGASKPRPRQPLIRSFYDLVEQFTLTGGVEPALDADIEKFTHSYIAFRQLLGPFEKQFRTVAAARGDIEREFADTRVRLDAEKEELARQVAEAAQQAADLGAALQEAQAERARLAEAHAALSQQLAEAGQALETERAAATRLSETLAETQANAQRMTAELEEARTACAAQVAQNADVSQRLNEATQALEAERAAARPTPAQNTPAEPLTLTQRIKQALQ
jgi:hypothetical protein